MSDIRVADTAQLNDIARAGDIHTYNARIERGLLSRLSPTGYHVLIRTARNHDDGRRTVAHHRTRALLKVEGSDDPVVITLDVSLSQWGNLSTATDALRAARLLKELN